VREMKSTKIAGVVDLNTERTGPVEVVAEVIPGGTRAQAGLTEKLKRVS